jgi:hypothetical protein
MTGTPDKGVSARIGGGVAPGVSGQLRPVHSNLKCRPRHLHHPTGVPGWYQSRDRGSVSRQKIGKIGVRLVFSVIP